MLVLDVVMALAYSHFNEGLIAIDQDTAIKHFVFDTSMFCTGRTMMESSGPVWVRLGTHCDSRMQFVTYYRI